MKIILIGYRAVGKTTVGKLLAGRLEIPFYDSDTLVEEMSGATVKMIVANYGWNYFRRKETAAIKLLTRRGQCVVATGGGAVLRAGNVKLLQQMGKIVWLDAPLEDIIDRLRDDMHKDAKRPQFTSDDLAAETASVLTERRPLYAGIANLVVNTAGKKIEQVTEVILQNLSPVAGGPR